MKTLKSLAGVLLILTLGACTQKQEVLSPEQAKQIAKEAYIYGFPMVVNYKTMYLYALNEKSPEYKGDFNQLSCAARLYTPDDKAIVTPNSDTPYCFFWADLRKEPVIITVPEMEEERFYHFQLIDLYTHNFAYIGTLSTGNKAGKYLVCTVDWKDEVPEGIDDVIYCETDLFFGGVRTQLMNDKDLENIKRIQGEYRLQTLSTYLGNEAPKTLTSDNFPDWIEGEQFTVEAYNYIDVMLNLLDPVEEEEALMKEFAKLGLGTDAPFEMEKFDEEIQKAIEEGLQEALVEIEEFTKVITSDPLGSAKIFGTRDFLNKSAKENYQLENFYILRTIAAHMGLYGNSGAEAIYPTYLFDSEGAPINASENNYTITFQEEELPPVKAFWSLSMYNGQTQLFIHNSLDRYLLNSNMLENFIYADDGSLTLYIQKDSPGQELEANWLPAPDGPLYMVLRLYGPEERTLKGDWVNPPLLKAN